MQLVLTLVVPCDCGRIGRSGGAIYSVISLFIVSFIRHLHWQSVLHNMAKDNKPKLTLGPDCKLWHFRQYLVGVRRCPAGANFHVILV